MAKQIEVNGFKSNFWATEDWSVEMYPNTSGLRALEVAFGHSGQVNLVIHKQDGITRISLSQRQAKRLRKQLKAFMKLEDTGE